MQMGDGLIGAPGRVSHGLGRPRWNFQEVRRGPGEDGGHDGSRDRQRHQPNLPSKPTHNEDAPQTSEQVEHHRSVVVFAKSS